MTRPPGRPPLDDKDKGTTVSTWLKPGDHDKLIQIAKQEEKTIAALVREWLQLKLR